MSMSGKKETLKELEELLESGDMQIERTLKPTLKDRYIGMVHRVRKKPVRMRVPIKDDGSDRAKGGITNIPRISDSNVDVYVRFFPRSLNNSYLSPPAAR